MAVKSESFPSEDISVQFEKEHASPALVIMSTAEKTCIDVKGVVSFAVGSLSTIEDFCVSTLEKLSDLLVDRWK